MPLTHVDAAGDAHMVDVGDKAVTRRTAIAEGYLYANPEALAAVAERRAKKGDVLTIAQIAGIQGAKRTSETIPLCHPLVLDRVDVVLTVEATEGRIRCEASAAVHGRTGVEMEALCGVTAALLCAWDMLKAVDRQMRLDGVRVLSKDGGRSGAWRVD